jgi:hypothetical protein
MKERLSRYKLHNEMIIGWFVIIMPKTLKKRKLLTEKTARSTMSVKGRYRRADLLPEIRIQDEQKLSERHCWR